MAIEEPSYKVLEKSGDLELRAYESKIVAEVFVSGEMNKASSAGFRLIADYIFGNNTSTTGISEKISMTAPVTMEPQSEKISMTAPVTLEKTAGRWRVHFVMPSSYTMASLPKPNNTDVTLREVAPANYAVITFSGLASQKKVTAQTDILMDWLDSKGIKTLNTPELARYNPPWTLPFLRRNEIMVVY